MQRAMAHGQAAVATSSVHRPVQARQGLAAAAAPNRLQQRGGFQRVRAEPDRPWNEGAAQVRRLVDRDRKELDLDELEAQFAEDPSASAQETAKPADSGTVAAAAPGEAPSPSVVAFQVTSAAADKRPVSPFGPSSSSSGSGSSNPFGAAGSAPKRPFIEPAGLSPNMPTPLKASSIQLYTTPCLFTTIITSMIATFFFVLSTGAIRFNE
ncbi:hypothetical protein ACK3TF_000343 [Chlorella vulgaris]